MKYSIVDGNIKGGYSVRRPNGKMMPNATGDRANYTFDTAKAIVAELNLAMEPVTDPFVDVFEGLTNLFYNGRKNR